MGKSMHKKDKQIPIDLYIYIGKVGITLNMNWNEPAIFNETSHIEAAETKQQFQTGWFANPIFVNGKYPDIMRQKVRLWAQSLTSLKADLRQKINRVFAYSRFCLNGTFL